jgi:N,N'-diacetyllegionaminate synthase
VKFQTHIAEAESTPGEPWRVKFSRQDATRFEYWKRMEFTESQWQGLHDHAEDRGLLFLSSPFSIEAAELLARVGVAAWKLASGEVNNPALLDCISQSHRPVFLSTGMSTIAEIDDAVARIRKLNLPLVVMQCTSAYPCPPENIGLNLLPYFRQRYDCGVGLSDHSGTVFPGLAAAWEGIDVLEVHLTFSRKMFGPDVGASLTPEDLKLLVDGIRFIEKMKAHPVDKDQMAADLAPLRNVFTKSIVARVDLPAGTHLQKHHLAFKKPGTGIPASKLGDVLDRRLKRQVSANALLHADDLE